MAVQSLERGIDILELVSRAPDGLLLSELGMRTGLPSSTTFNLANTLVKRGLLEKSRHPVRYQVGPALLNLLGNNARSTKGVPDAFWLDLFRNTEADSLVMVRWSNSDCLLEIRIDSARPDVIQKPAINVPSPYSFATALCVLAFLPQEDRLTYERRYPFNEYGVGAWSTARKMEEFFSQTRKSGLCHPPISPPERLAVPLFDSNSLLFGAVGVSMHEASSLNIESAARHLREAAQTLSCSL